MVENKTFGSRLFDVINVIILAILAISCLYPLWYTLCVSISNKSAVASGQVTFWPVGVNGNAYSLIMVMTPSGIPLEFLCSGCFLARSLPWWLSL